VVTGSISEEIAVACIQQGAFDYLLKDRISRFGAAVVNAMEAKQRRAEQRRAEQELRDSEKRFRLLADNSTDIISVQNLASELVDVSPACEALLGYTPEEMLGRPCYLFCHEDDVERVRAGRISMLSSGEMFSATYRMRAKDGHYVWVESLARSIRDEGTREFQELRSRQAMSRRAKWPSRRCVTAKSASRTLSSTHRSAWLSSR
jgi:PAS domain S-box-containing protein